MEEKIEGRTDRGDEVEGIEEKGRKKGSFVTGSGGGGAGLMQSAHVVGTVRTTIRAPS